MNYQGHPIPANTRREVEEEEGDRVAEGDKTGWGSKKGRGKEGEEREEEKEKEGKIPLQQNE